VLPPRNAVHRNRFSLATLASASPHGVEPLSENITPSTQALRVRKFACANVLILMSPEIAHDHYPARLSLNVRSYSCEISRLV
jgi:hypothetical protein